MENVNDRRLSFGQRNWLLLCILVAIISPLVVRLVENGARKQAYKQSVDIRFSDTSNKIASPPSTSTKPAGNGADSSSNTQDSAKK